MSDSAERARTRRDVAKEVLGIEAEALRLMAERIDEALRGQELDKLLADNISIYQNAGGGMVPKLLFGKYVATGVTPSAAALFRVLEQKWHIRPSDP